MATGQATIEFIMAERIDEHAARMGERLFGLLEEPQDVRDLNGDGTAEIIITETGTFCYGATGQGFYIMQKTPAGGWKTFFESQGIPNFQATKGVGGWPDIELGGPGFCFPVVRFNGKAYANHRQKEEQPGACALR